MGTCKTCRWYDAHMSYCNNQDEHPNTRKIHGEGSVLVGGDEINIPIPQDGLLVRTPVMTYVGSTIFVGPDFGCVHHKEVQHGT